MTPEDQWHINSVKDNYHTLNLSFEQAEQIYKFEEDNRNYSEKYHFSTWEESDYELSTFRKILHPEQFTIFEQSVKETIENYQQSLIEQDEKNLKEIECNKEIIKYYEEQFLPEFFKDPVLYGFQWFWTDRTKIDFLKAEYKNFLTDLKKRILTDHFRHSRTFAPNEFEVALLRHNVLYLWPDYYSFEEQMDEPTKAIAAYLKEKLSYFLEKYDELITSKLQALEIFQKEIFDKYHKDDLGGWHTTIERKTKPEEEGEYRGMCLLLLNREKYGC